MRPKLATFAASFLIVAILLFAARPAHSVQPTAEGKDRVFEIRTYTTEPGKLPDLLKRFRDHTTKLFEKHGMTNIGYWVPADAPNSENTLVYIIAHKDREAAKKSWADFRADPEWQAVVKESQKDGPLTTKPPESVFLNPTDYSPIK